MAGEFRGKVLTISWRPTLSRSTIIFFPPIDKAAACAANAKTVIARKSFIVRELIRNFLKLIKITAGTTFHLYTNQSTIQKLTGACAIIKIKVDLLHACRHLVFNSASQPNKLSRHMHRYEKAAQKKTCQSFPETTARSGIDTTCDAVCAAEFKFMRGKAGGLSLLLLLSPSILGRRTILSVHLCSR